MSDLESCQWTEIHNISGWPKKIRTHFIGKKSVLKMYPKIFGFLTPSTKDQPWDWHISLHLQYDRVRPTCPPLGGAWSWSFTLQGLTCFFIFQLYVCHNHWYTTINALHSSRWVWVSLKFLASAFEEPVIPADFGVWLLPWDSRAQEKYIITEGKGSTPGGLKLVDLCQGPNKGRCLLVVSAGWNSVCIDHECRVMFLADPTMKNHPDDTPKLFISHVRVWQQRAQHWEKPGHLASSNLAILFHPACFFPFLPCRCHQCHTQPPCLCSFRWVWISPGFSGCCFLHK